MPKKNTYKNIKLIDTETNLIKSVVDKQLSSSTEDVFGYQNLLQRSEDFPDTQYWNGGFNNLDDNFNLLNQNAFINKSRVSLTLYPIENNTVKSDFQTITYNEEEINILHFTETMNGGVYISCDRLTIGKEYTLSFIAKANPTNLWQIGHENGGVKVYNLTNELKSYTYTFIAKDNQFHNFVIYGTKNGNEDLEITIGRIMLTEKGVSHDKYNISLANSYKYYSDTHPWITDNRKLLIIFNKRPIRQETKENIDGSFCIRYNGKSNSKEYPEYLRLEANTDYTFTIEAFNNYALGRAAIYYLYKDENGNNQATQLFSGLFGNREEALVPHSFTFNSGPTGIGTIRIDNNGKLANLVNNRTISGELWISRVKLELGNHFTGFSRSFLEITNK